MRISDWSSDVCSSDLDSGLGIKSGNSGPTRAAPLSQRSLRAKFHFEFAGQILALEFLVLTYIGADHFLDLPRAQQLAQPFIVDARIIGCDGKILDPRRMHSINQPFGNATQSAPACTQMHAI